MAKKARVYDGTAWQELASAQTDLTAYSTTAQMDAAIAASKGLTLVSTNTFTSVSSYSLPDNTFTSVYDNYLLILDFVPGSGLNAEYRYRTSGTDNSTSNYNYQYMQISGTGTSIGRSSSTTSHRLGYCVGQTCIQMNVYAPNLSKITSAQLTNSNRELNVFAELNYNNFNATTSFDSMTFILSSGSTGKVTVYGYKV